MKITNCLHPNRVYNKYLNEYMYVPCGKCSSCRNIRQHDWIQRLQQESQKHRYTIFFTLTYDDDCLPRFVKDGDYLVSATRLIRTHSTNGNIVERVICDAECFPISELDLSNPRDKAYFDRYSYFSYTSVIDVQKFVKRVRYYINELFKKNHSDQKKCPASYRTKYFIISEFAPFNQRAHIHGLFYFDSEEVAKEIERIIRQSWLLCDERFKCVEFSDPASASYVAKYMQKSDSLPSVFRHHSLKPFALFSKRPFIGHDRLSMQQIRQIIVETKLYTAKFDNTKKKCTLAYHERSFVNRYFPKCYGYSLLPAASRVGLYTCVSRWQTFEFGSFFKYVSLMIEQKPQSSDRYLFIYIRERVLQFFKDNFDVHFLNVLYHIFCVSKRIDSFSKLFNFTPKFYAEKIIDYYSALDADNLRRQYVYMTEYMESWKCNDSKDLDLLFPDSCLDYYDNLKINKEYLGLKSMTDKMIRDMDSNKKRKMYNRMKENPYITKRIY